MTRHYHQGHNVIGYMPVWTFRTKREAVASSSHDANDHLLSLLDTDFHTATKIGNRGDYYVNDGDTHSLDRHYWVDGPCTCAEGEQELTER